MTQQPHDIPQTADPGPDRDLSPDAVLASGLAELAGEAADTAIADVRRLGISETELPDADIIDLLNESIAAELGSQ